MQSIDKEEALERYRVAAFVGWQVLRGFAENLPPFSKYLKDTGLSPDEEHLSDEAKKEIAEAEKAEREEEKRRALEVAAEIVSLDTRRTARRKELRLED